MSVFEDDFIQKYMPVFDGKLYWDTAPAGQTPTERNNPFGIVQQVGGDNRKYVDDTEQPEFLTARLQLYVWGARRNEVSPKMREFVSFAKASNTKDWYIREAGAAVGDFNDVLQLRGQRQDFILTFKNPDYP